MADELILQGIRYRRNVRGRWTISGADVHGWYPVDREWSNALDEIERLRAAGGESELKVVADVLYRLADGERKMDHGRRQLEIWGVPESFIVWMLRETPKGTSDEH